MIENFIELVFGINCKIEKTKVKGLPLYMTAGREFFLVNTAGTSFILIKIPSDDRFGAIALEKQYILFKEATDSEVAFYFVNLTKLQRNALLEKNLPFVSGTDQIYLPFLGVYIRNNLKETKKTYSEKMMPATQILFLYLLYYHQQDYVLKKQAADDLGLTRTSITRASEQLKEMNLISEEPCGKEIRMRTVASGGVLYQKAKQFLITPVQHRIYVKSADIGGKKIKAGESALSRVSMLGKPKYETLALYKADNLNKDLTEVDVKWQENIDVVQLELWKYDPALFARNGIVDPISLALSLKDNDDERVQKELNIYLEGYKW